MFPGLRDEPRVAMIVATAVLDHSFFSYREHLTAEVSGVTGLQGHFKCRALQMTFEDQSILEVNVSLEIRLRKQFFWVINKMLIHWIGVCNEDSKGVFLSPTCTPALLTLLD